MIGHGVRTTDLERAGRQIVRSALRPEAGEGLVVIGDEGSRAMANAVATAAEAEDVTVFSIWLEELGRRPLIAVPDRVVRRLQKSSACIFLAGAPHKEARMRQHLLGLVANMGIRHAHMEGVSELAFVEGMQADYREVSRVGRAMLDRVNGASTVRCDSRWGTFLEASFFGAAQWFSQLGEVASGTWTTLPSGALYASPDDVDGVFVANASLGEFFGHREGSLVEAPVRLSIRRRRIVAVESESRELQKDIEETLAFGENSDRVGLVAIGVNLGMTTPTGESDTDLNLPGLHLIIGDPASKITGAKWSARTSFAACQADSTVRVDNDVLIHEGVVVLG